MIQINRTDSQYNNFILPLKCGSFKKKSPLTSGGSSPKMISNDDFFLDSIKLCVRFLTHCSSHLLSF